MIIILLANSTLMLNYIYIKKNRICLYKHIDNRNNNMCITKMMCLNLTSFLSVNSYKMLSDI